MSNNKLNLNTTINEQKYIYTIKGISLDSHFLLTEEQESAISNIINKLIHSRSKTFTLEGIGGSGKTSTIRMVEQYLQHIGKKAIFCAPTNKAVFVLKEQELQSQVMTLHKLLRIKVSADLDNFDARNLESIIDKKAKNELVGSVNYVIIDECSMVNDDLYGFINDVVIKKYKKKIIWMGDSKQLRPVKGTAISKTFTSSDNSCLLKQVKRTDKLGILNITNALREKRPFDLEPSEAHTFTSSNTEFLKLGLEYFKDLNNNINCCRVLCGTNAAVGKYNRHFHKYLFPNGQEYNPGELIMSYWGNDEDFCNSMEAVVAESKEIEIELTDNLKVKGHSLLLGSGSVIDVVSRDNDWDLITSEIKRLITEKDWNTYYGIQKSYRFPKNLYDFVKERFLLSKSIDYGYALTVHKSQGSTYKNVLVDIESFSDFRKDSDNYRELLYVAFSRCQNSFIGLTSKGGDRISFRRNGVRVIPPILQSKKEKALSLMSATGQLAPKELVVTFNEQYPGERLTQR